MPIFSQLVGAINEYRQLYVYIDREVEILIHILFKKNVTSGMKKKRNKESKSNLTLKNEKKRRRIEFTLKYSSFNTTEPTPADLHLNLPEAGHRCNRTEDRICTFGLEHQTRSV
jgi:hypothetical protein